MRVEVIAIETIARLQAQRVARAEADQGHFLGGQQGPRDILDPPGGHRQLEAVFAAVTATVDKTIDPADPECRPAHKAERRRRWAKGAHHPRRRRPLQGQQAVPVQDFKRAVALQSGLYIFNIALLAGGVQHDEKMIAGLGHHHIVDDPARGIGEHGITLPARGKVAETAWGQGLQQRGPILAGQFYLAHVGNIKQAGLGAGVQMLLLDAARVAFQEARELRGGLRARRPDAPRIVYRHLITGKRDHARAMFQMELIQCCFLHVRFLMGCRPALFTRLK